MITVKAPREQFERLPSAEVSRQAIAEGDEVSFTMPLWRPGGATFQGAVTRVGDDQGAVGVKVQTEGGRWIVFLVPAWALRKIAKREDAA